MKDTHRSVNVIMPAKEWNSSSGASWAALLGMVHVPMFGPGKEPKGAKGAAILLDGRRGSFAFLSTEDADFAFEQRDPLSWSWSSCVRHLVAVMPSKGTLCLRRWDDPETIRRFEIPRQGQGAASLLALMEATEDRSRRPDAVRYVMEPFRQIRTRIGPRNALWAVKFLNGLLLVAEAFRRTKIRRKDIDRIRTFGGAFSLLPNDQRELCGVTDIDISREVREMADQDAGDLIRRLVDPDPYTGCELDPTLLFRHAASQLYQEAHLELERDPQGYFSGLEPTNQPVGRAGPHDVRFTPPNLARALVEKALHLQPLPDPRQDLTILDPACGSGIFLIDAIRELELSAAPSGRGRVVKVVGYDKSEISKYTTSVCLKNHATQGPPLLRNLQTTVKCWDSLKSDNEWVASDIILMNPPFIPWQGMSDDQRSVVNGELRKDAGQRPDIAMAFVSKAVRSLKPGGVLGCVLPASLLSSQSGLAWRERLAAEGRLQLLGCFEGYTYFPTSLVETAFLVYRKDSAGRRRPGSVEVVVSDEGKEDAALRALRLEPAASPVEGVDRYWRPAEDVSPANWRPLRQSQCQEKERLARLPFGRIGRLFRVRQGVRLGHRVFLITAEQYNGLGRETRFFRPAAGGGSIRDGRLRKAEYIFYPYASDGNSLFDSERELEAKVPTYYGKHLEPCKGQLAKRAGADPKRWWELTRKRSWQTNLAPRLVSTYFGESGSFAFDEAGEYVTVNGHAWLWKGDRATPSKDSQVPFEQTPAVWAYLALLNSRPFEEIVSLYSVSLQGGQMRLEPRFLNQIPLPNLTDEAQVSASAVRALVRLGRSVHAEGVKAVAAELEEQVSRLYRRS